MSNKLSNYILNYSKIKDSDFELVGKEALVSGALSGLKVNIPNGFVVTSVAFDDFLSSAQLVEPIINSLRTVRPFIRQTAQSASESINSRILIADFPEIIARSIITAYKNISSVNEEPLVVLNISNIIDEKYLPNLADRYKNIICKGPNDLLQKIKQLWMSLFTTEGIEYRANNYYKGPISIAINIQKFVSGEITGRAYSFSEESSQFKIESIYGNLPFNDQTLLNSYDIYKIDKEKGEIKEKIVKPQDFMYVRKTSLTNLNDLSMKVDISPSWRNHSKINDDQILDIADFTKELSNNFKNKIIIDWAIEGGDLFILKLESLGKYEEKNILEESKESKNEKHSKNEVIESKLEKPDIKALTEEVKKIAQDQTKVEKEIELPPIPIMHTNLGGAHKEKPLQREPELIEIVQTENDFESVKVNAEENLNYESYLDISQMRSSQITALHSYSGGLLDATEMILFNNDLPDKYVSNRIKLNEFIDKFTIFLNTSLTTLKGKQLFYQFSAISEKEIKLLGENPEKYSYFDERFQKYPDLLLIELLAAKKASRESGNSNLNYVVPGLRTVEAFQKLEKILASQIKSTNNLFIQVDFPSLTFDLMVNQFNISGLIVDLNKYAKFSLQKKELTEAELFEFAKKTLDLFTQISLKYGYKTLFRIDYSLNLLKLLLEKQFGIIYNFPLTKEQIQESNRILGYQ